MDYSDANASANGINSWVENKTRELNIIEPSRISPDTKLSLASAIYFKGFSANKFDPEKTAEEVPPNLVRCLLTSFLTFNSLNTLL